MGLWTRYVAEPLIACGCASSPIMKERAKILPLATGHVLEIGCGSGNNFSLYDPDKVQKLYALEPAAGMLERARNAIKETKLAEKTRFLHEGAQAISLPDDSIDTVVVTFVLCTIPDWRASLVEARRVLKPGGQLLFAEHGLSDAAKTAKWQRRIEPVWKRAFGGCHLTRDPLDMLRASGFDVVEHECHALPNTPRIAGFVSRGTARIM